MNPVMYSTRCLAKGRIDDLSNGFRLSNGVPFSVFLWKKTSDDEYKVLVNCKLICDREMGDFPVLVDDWTPGVISELAPNSIDLEKYEVFWGAGEEAK